MNDDQRTDPSHDSRKVELEVTRGPGKIGHSAHKQKSFEVVGGPPKKPLVHVGGLINKAPPLDGGRRRTGGHSVSEDGTILHMY